MFIISELINVVQRSYLRFKEVIKTSKEFELAEQLKSFMQINIFINFSITILRYCDLVYRKSSLRFD